MPVRGVFLVIGAVAIVGLASAVIVRQSNVSSDDLSRFMDSGTLPSVQPVSNVFVADATPPTGSSRPSLANNNLLFPGAAAQSAPNVAVPAAPSSSDDGDTSVPATPAPAVNSAAPSSAQTPPAAATTVAVPPTNPNIDETALRYFARQGNTRRLNAEIARLKTLYPDWYPPSDMTAPISIPDPLLDQMWKLYSDGQYAAVRAAIVDRVAHEPGWTVPADLLKRLDVGEARDRLINASTAKQWNTVVSIAATQPSLLTCSDIDILWRVAEAFANTDRMARARDVDVYILNNCQDPKERLATVQKAMAFLGDSELNELLALERTGADGQGEFASVRGDIARRRIGAAAKDPKLSVTPEELALVEQLAENGKDANDAVLLGGYLFQHNDAAGSAKWFELAKTRADTPEIARGLAYALNELKRPAEAEAVAYNLRDSTPENKQAYLIVATALLTLDPPVKLDPDILARMAKTIGDAKYPQGAQELGWYAYNTGQTLVAARWFTAALTWRPDDEPAAFGLALAYDRLGLKDAFQKVVKVWGPRSERIALLADPKARALIRPVGSDLTLPPSIAEAAGGGVVAGRVIETTAPLATGQTPVRQYLPAETVAATRPVMAASQPVAATRRIPATEAVSTSNSGRNCAGNVRPAQLSGMSALNRGWCLMNLNRPVEAADAFDMALSTSSGQAREDAAYGKTLANLRSGLTGAAAVSAASSAQGGVRNTEMEVAILTQRALASYADARYVEALLFLDRRSQIAPEQNDLLMIRGWSYYHLHRLSDAKRVFVAVAGTGSREALRALSTIAAGANGNILGDTRERR